MSIPKLFNHKNYMNKSTSATPTTKGDMYQLFDNYGTVIEDMVAATLWQPATAYEAGMVVKSPSLPSGYVARCKKADTSSEEEPSWQAGDVTDNGATWTVTKAVLVADLATSAEAKAGTGDKVITAATLKAVIDAAIDAAIANATAVIDAAIANATAAIEKQAKLDAHPVGSYYFSDDATSPATLFGGTWEALPAGYTLIAQGSGTDDFGSFTYTAGQKYGERMHKLTVEELAEHTPSFNGGGNALVMNNTVADTTLGLLGDTNSLWHENSKTIHAGFNSIGKSIPHNTLSPSVATYGWKRVS